MAQARDHRVDDEHEQNEAGAEEEEAHGLRDLLAALPLVLDGVVLEPALGDEPVVPALPLVELRQ